MNMRRKQRNQERRQGVSQSANCASRSNSLHLQDWSSILHTGHRGSMTGHWSRSDAHEAQASHTHPSENRRNHSSVEGQRHVHLGQVDLGADTAFEDREQRGSYEAEVKPNASLGRSALRLSRCAVWKKRMRRGAGR